MYTQKTYTFIFWLVGDSPRYGEYEPFYGLKSAFGKWKKYLEIIISSEANNCYANIIDMGCSVIIYQRGLFQAEKMIGDSIILAYDCIVKCISNHHYITDIKSNF